MIQTIFEYKKDDSHIDRVSQLKDRNCLYFGIKNSCFELNLKNRKIKYSDLNTHKWKYTL